MTEDGVELTPLEVRDHPDEDALEDLIVDVSVCRSVDGFCASDETVFAYDTLWFSKRC